MISNCEAAGNSWLAFLVAAAGPSSSETALGDRRPFESRALFRWKQRSVSTCYSNVDLLKLTEPSCRWFEVASSAEMTLASSRAASARDLFAVCGAIVESESLCTQRCMQFFAGNSGDVLLNWEVE